MSQMMLDEEEVKQRQMERDTRRMSKPALSDRDAAMQVKILEETTPKPFLINFKDYYTTFRDD